jgi:5-methylcytosine-specific restriction endonuclease McrA
MCRQADKKNGRPFPDNPAGDWCTELEKVWSEKWYPLCPFQPPEKFLLQEKVNEFIETIQSFCKDQATTTIEDVINKAQHDELRKWYIEHGQKSGYHRQKIYDRYSVPVSAFQDRERKDIPKSLERQVFIRDHYHCRYCGNKLIAKEVWEKLAKIANDDRLRLFRQTLIQAKPDGTTKAGNEDVPGLFFFTCTSPDHVVPYSLNGSTTIENLVASCYNCNFGKGSYTCYQIGIEDPFRRSPMDEEWDGLSGLIPTLNNIIKRLSQN